MGRMCAQNLCAAKKRGCERPHVEVAYRSGYGYSYLLVRSRAWLSSTSRRDESPSELIGGAHGSVPQRGAPS